MKKFRIVMALLCLAAGVGLVSCQPSNPTETPTGETTKYIVTFNTNGGSVVTAAEVVEGEKVTKPADPTKNGYTFKGWYKDAECNQSWNFDTDVVTASTNLYAKWEENKVEETSYKATLKYNNGEPDGILEAVKDGDSYYIDAPKTNPKKPYMEFDFWAADEAGTTKFNFADPITGNVTLYAIYKQAFDKVSTEFNVDEAANIAGASLTEDTTFFGRFTLGKGMKLESDKDAINTQGKSLSFDLTAADNRNSVVFNAAGASSSGDTEISLINLTTGETVETWSVQNKVTVDKTISNLPAGSYQITTSRSARVYAFAITEELPQSPTTGINLSSLGTKKDFLLGSEFSPTGLDVKLIYENGREDSLALDDANISLSEVDMTTAGVKTITVTYQVNAETSYSASYEITVYKPTELVIYDYVLNANRQTVHRQEVFVKDSTFSFENNVVKAKCLIPGTENYIEFLLTANDYTVSSPDLSSTGLKNVVVTYKADEALTEEFNIHVVDTTIDASANKISFYVNCYNSFTYTANNTTEINVLTINQATQYAELLNIADSVTKQIAVANNEVHFEKVEITLPNTKLTSYGEGPATIEFNALNGLVDPSETISYSTDGSATVSVRESAEGFKAYDIIINNYYNTHERYEESKLIAGSGTQAVALLLQADKVVLEKVTLTSYQDTLYAQVGRHYFKDCTIIGRTDYIFGYDATSYFENCTLKTIGAGLDQNNGGYVVATKGNPSGTPGSDSYNNIKYGYIFNNCTFTADENTMPGSVTLARGWDVGMTMMVMNSSISHHFSKEAYGYVTPDDPQTEETEKNLNDRYGKMNADPVANQLLEYNNTGEGAITESIANTCTVVNAEIAKLYTVDKAFTANNGTTVYDAAWNPVATKDATVKVLNSDDSIVLVAEGFGYSGASATEEEFNALITLEVTPVGKVFAGFYADKELTTPYNFATPLTTETIVYAKWLSADSLAPTTITFDDLAGDITTEVVYANGLVTVVGHADRKFTADGSAKTITDVNGNEIVTTTRLKTGGSTNSKGRYIIIDLSNYSGEIEIGIWAITGSSSSDRTGQFRKDSLDGESIGVVNCPAGTEPIYSTVTVIGGSVYYITADASINYYGINISQK